MKWLRARPRVVVQTTLPVAITDAHPNDGPSTRGEGDPERERSEKRRRRIRLLAFNALVFAGLLAAVVGRGGLLDLVRHRNEREEVRRKVEEQRVRVEALRRTVEALQHDPLARERIAREELGLASPGEIQFLLPRQPGVDPLGDETGFLRDGVEPPREDTPGTVD